MPTSQAITFTIGALLGTTWTSAFAAAKKDPQSLAEKTQTSFEKARKALLSTRKELSAFQKTLGDKPPSEAQTAALQKLTAAAASAELARLKSDSRECTIKGAAVPDVSAERFLAIDGDFSPFAGETWRVDKVDFTLSAADGLKMSVSLKN